MKIANLHIHSEYSFLASTLRIPKIVGYSRFNGYSHVAICDLFSTYGFFELKKCCEKEGLLPVYGLQIFLKHEMDKHSFPAIIFAINNTGLKNIFTINTIIHEIHLKTSKYSIDFKTLKEYKDGLIFIVENELLHYKYNPAILKKIIERYTNEFEENFFVEVNYTGKSKIPLLRNIIEIINTYQLKGIPTAEARYENGSKEAFDFLSALREKSFKKNEKGIKLNLSYDYSLKTKEEFLQIFKNHPELIENLEMLLNKFQATLELTNSDILTEETSRELEKKCMEKLYKYITGKPIEEKKKYQTRLKEELKIVKEKRLENLFFISSDIAGFLKKNNIPYGPGRGSSCASLILFLLGINKIDPIKYNLLFERFLNPERSEIPDIDLDICWKKRKLLFSYLFEKYKNRIAHIATINRLFPHTLLNELAKVYKLKKEKVKKIKRFFPNTSHFSINDLLKTEKKLLDLYAGDNEIKDFLDIMMKLEGLAYYPSIHAGGIIITPDEIKNYVTLEKTRVGNPLAQIKKDDLKETNFIKIDLLGLRFITVIDDVRRKAKLKKIPLYDEKTFETIQKGDTIGIFQLESYGMRELLKRIKPANINELSDVIALYRPGPIRSGMTEEYQKRKGSIIKSTIVEHPLIKNILDETYGVFIYQEQILLLAHNVAKFSWKKADLFRKALSEKNVKIIITLKEDFIAGCLENGLSKEESEKLFSIITDFGSYCFNKAHSISYAYNAYLGAYLKTHHPLEFYIAMLNNYTNYFSKLDRLLFEIRRRGYKILPFDINNCNVYFKKENNSIRPGLSFIKYITPAFAREIIRERTSNGKFKDLIDFSIRMKNRNINIRELEYLIKAGCFDFTNLSRKKMLKASNEILKEINHIKSEEEKGISELFTIEEELDIKNFIDNTVAEENSVEKLHMELEATELYFTHHPLEEIEEKIKDWELDTIETLERIKYAVVVAFVQSIRIFTTNYGEKLAILNIIDKTASTRAILLPSLFSKYSDIIEKGKIYLFKGKSKGGKLFLEELFLLK